MHLASFGPVVVVAIPPNLLVLSKHRYHLKIIVRVLQIKRNMLPWAQTTPDMSFGPVVGIEIPVGRLLLIHLKKERKNIPGGSRRDTVSSPHESLCG
jgi:hypothetical protein